MNRLPELSTAFINHCRYAKNLSENSLRAYQQDLDDFCRYAEIAKFEKTIEGSHIEKFARFLNEKKSLNPRTIKRKIACLSSFFNWQEESGTLEVNPVAKAKISLKCARKLPIIISRQELGQIAKGNVARTISPTSVIATCKQYTNLMAILLMSCTGIRVGELVRIRLNDIDLANNKIKIHGKGSRERYVYITNKICPLCLGAITSREKEVVTVQTDCYSIPEVSHSPNKP